MARAKVRGLVIEGTTSVEPLAPKNPAGGTAGVPRVRRTLADKIVPIDEETWHIHGPAMTKWTEKHIYWVLPLGTLLLFCLILWASGFSFRQGGTSVQNPVPATALSPPQVNLNVPNTINATVRVVSDLPSAPAELSPEELDRRHTEYLLSRGQ